MIASAHNASKAGVITIAAASSRLQGISSRSGINHAEIDVIRTMVIRLEIRHEVSVTVRRRIPYMALAVVMIVGINIPSCCMSASWRCRRLVRDHDYRLIEEGFLASAKRIAIFLLAWPARRIECCLPSSLIKLQHRLIAPPDAIPEPGLQNAHR